VERYSDLLYGTAYLMLRNRGHAEDAVQEAFVSAWRGIDTFRPEAELRPWLLRILVNHVLQRRRHKVLGLVTLPEFGLEIADSTPGPELSAERNWERRELSRALSKLPAKYARPLILRFFSELSQAEVALALQIPEGTVKSRLHRALQELHRELLRRKVP
jgi:RNA polymerase sigma-70 factor (ECF subfamily)